MHNPDLNPTADLEMAAGQSWNLKCIMSIFKLHYLYPNLFIYIKRQWHFVMRSHKRL